MGLLGPTIEQISNKINRSYYNRFPEWLSIGTKEDYLNMEINGNLNSNNLKYYWICRGTIFVKDTKYNPPKNGFLYRAEFSGKREFQLDYFDLDKNRQCNKMAEMNMSKMKKIIDKYEQKLIEERL